MTTVETQVTFRDLDPSPTLEAFARRWVERLALVYDRLGKCDVTVSIPHRHHATGRMFHVHIIMAVPGRTLVVSRDHDVGDHDSAQVAVRDAFRAARRQLEDHARVERGEVKHHQA